MMKVSVGIVTYNDFRNVFSLIDYFCRFKDKFFEILEIIIIATDDYPEFSDKLNEYAFRNKAITCFFQNGLQGKSEAVRFFLNQARGDIMVLSSGDVFPAEDALMHLLQPFRNPEVGMTGPQINCINVHNSFMGKCDKLLWELHHELSLLLPKLGELVVFRKKAVNKMRKTLTDEAFLESEINANGYRLVYVPQAVVHNYAYDDLSGYLAKRVRISLGHKKLKKESGYRVSSERYNYLMRAVMNYFIKKPLFRYAWRQLFFVFLVELLARFLSHLKLLFCSPKKYIWPLNNNKRLISLSDYI
jgi:cellulose synthase/poly-beta-1,6-N-acetylglucosamine synthase-like glycosyltransferase